MTKKIIIVLLVAAALVGILFFVFKKDAPITNYPPQGKTVVAFGDSLVEGVGANPGNDFVSILSRAIGQPIVNMGVSGDTSVRGLDRIDKVIAQDPRVVLLLFGGNDALHKVPIATTFKTIDEMVVKIQSSGAVVVLLGIRGSILSDPYQEHFEKIAKARGTLYVPDVLDNLIGNRKYMSDAIHPNDVGYKKIAEKVLPILQKAF